MPPGESVAIVASRQNFNFNIIGGIYGEMKRNQIVVLYGGRSNEHEVSLQSAASVIRNLDTNRYTVIPIGIDKQGNWKWTPNTTPSIPASAPSVYMPPMERKIVEIASNKVLATVDMIFPVMHGSFYEDGAIQGACEIAGIPYVGSGIPGSAIAMDKDIAKRLVEHKNISVVPYTTVYSSQDSLSLSKAVEYPVFVKPASLGSSVGISKVSSPEELDPALKIAFQFDRKVLLEKYIPGREIEVAVLENRNFLEPPRTSLPGEIVSNPGEFYSYEAKYIHGDKAKLCAPAPLKEEQVQAVQALAGKIFRCLECRGMARVDFFLDEQSNTFYFNEINSIPGFTDISMFPKLWEISGLSYTSLLTELIELAWERDRESSALRRTFSESP